MALRYIKFRVTGQSPQSSLEFLTVLETTNSEAFRKQLAVANSDTGKSVPCEVFGFWDQKMEPARHFDQDAAGVIAPTAELPIVLVPRWKRSRPAPVGLSTRTFLFTTGDRLVLQFTQALPHAASRLAIRMMSC